MCGSPQPHRTASALTPSPVTYKWQPTRGRANAKNYERSEQMNTEESKEQDARALTHIHSRRGPPSPCPSLTPPPWQLGHPERRVEPVSTHMELGHGTTDR